MSHVAAPSASRRVRRHVIVIGSVVLAGALLAGGISAAAAASSAQAEAAEQARVAARDAQLEAKHQEARAALVIDDATAIAASDTTLVSDEDKAALQQLATSLKGVSAEAAVDAARLELTRVLTAAIATSQAASEAAPLADAAVRQALVDAQQKLVAADHDERPVAEFVAAMSVAVGAVNDSQRVAAAAKSAGSVGRPGYGVNDEGSQVPVPTPIG